MNQGKILTDRFHYM